MSAVESIGLLGFGEVGQKFADDLCVCSTVRLHAFDIRFDSVDSGPSRALRSRSGVAMSKSAVDLASKCDLVISAVTAASATDAAESVAGGMRKGSFLLDINSVSPGVKRRIAGIVEDAGGRFIEAAMMSPVSPRGVASPISLGGPHSAAFLDTAKRLGFCSVSICSVDIGKASATRMCRSVMIKGLEALFAESLLSARYYEVEHEVLASLENVLGKGDWGSIANYMVKRSIEHGVRRAEEMREAAATVADAGLEPWMSEACARRQDWAAQFPGAMQNTNLHQMLDAIRTELMT
jgi:3-hydroxyisobutyrate dehydrogenase-like beta-hydroxyacid dehydrogenase